MVDARRVTGNISQRNRLTSKPRQAHINGVKETHMAKVQRIKATFLVKLLKI
jgi:hypothetical protein